MKRTLRPLLLALTVAVLGLTGVVMENARAGQPHMENALHNLQVARHQLEMARPDKGGHRVNAIGMIDNAISEVKAGMDAAD